MMHGDPSSRLVSLDVLRGLTIAGMILVNNPGSWSRVYGPLRHAEWYGWAFPDVIFPFFLFIVGAAVAYSFGARLESGAAARSLHGKIIRRTIILFTLGLFLNAFPSFDLATLRIPGVLQRIAVCYLVTAMVFVHSTWKGRLAWIACLLLAYWAVMEWLPVPGAGMYAEGSNAAAFVDGFVLKGHLWQATRSWDPEGIVSTIPAAATTLFGALAGEWLRSGREPLTKAGWLLVAGSAAVAAGAWWHAWLPINKSLWTGSFAVFMAGLAAICLGICYLVVDVRGWRRWTQPALVYGRNAIAVFVLAGIIARLLYAIHITTAAGDRITIKAWIYNTLFASRLAGPRASLAYAITFIVVMYLCMLPLYRKKIFLKI